MEGSMIIPGALFDKMKPQKVTAVEEGYGDEHGEPSFHMKPQNNERENMVVPKILHDSPVYSAVSTPVPSHKLAAFCPMPREALNRNSASENQVSVDSIKNNTFYTLTVTSSTENFAPLSNLSVILFENSTSPNLNFRFICDDELVASGSLKANLPFYVTPRANSINCGVKIFSASKILIESPEINLSSNLILGLKTGSIGDNFPLLPILASSNDLEATQINLEISTSQKILCNDTITTNELYMLNLTDKKVCKAIDASILGQELTVSVFSGSSSKTVRLNVPVTLMNNQLTLSSAYDHIYHHDHFNLLFTSNLLPAPKDAEYTISVNFSCGQNPGSVLNFSGSSDDFAYYLVGLPFSINGTSCEAIASLSQGSNQLITFPTFNYQQSLDTAPAGSAQIVAYSSYKPGLYYLASHGISSLSASDYKLNLRPGEWAYYFAESTADLTPYDKAGYGINGWEAFTSTFSPGHVAYHGLTGFFFFTPKESGSFNISLISGSSQNDRSIYCNGHSNTQFGYWNDNCGASAICSSSAGTSSIILELEADHTIQCAFQDYMGDDLGFFKYYYTEISLNISGPGFSTDQVQGVQYISNDGSYSLTDSSVVPYTYREDYTVLSGNPNWNDQVYFLNKQLTAGDSKSVQSVLYSIIENSKGYTVVIAPTNTVDGTPVDGQTSAKLSNGTHIVLDYNKATKLNLPPATTITISNTNIATPSTKTTNKELLDLSCSYSVFSEMTAKPVIQCVVMESEFADTTFSKYETTPVTLFYSINNGPEQSISRSTGADIVFEESSLVNASYSVYAKTSNLTSATLNFKTHHLGPGSYYNQNTSSIEHCSVGNYCSGDGLIRPCNNSDQYQDLTAQSSCKTVNNGYYKLSNSAQLICPPGSFCVAGVKTSCAPGTFNTEAGSQACLTCKAGSYTPTTYSCISCPAGSFAGAPGSGSCSKCPIGSYQPDSGKSSCITAEAPYYVNSTGSTTESKCNKPGYFLKDNNCVICQAGNYCPGTGKIIAITSPNEWAPTGAFKPSVCNAPKKVFDDHTSCALCSNGQFSKDGLCLQCPVGSYCKSGEATLCPAGTYSALMGQSSCQSCLVGSYSSSGATKCLVAEAGTYSPTLNSTKAIECSGSLQYQPKSGQGSCLTLKAGEYKISDKEASTCPIGFYCPGNGSKLPCDKANQYANATGLSKCLVVPVGFYKINNDAAEICPSGNKCIDGVKSACNATTMYQPKEGQSLCLSINGTEVKVSDSKITECPANHSCSDGVAAACPTGYTSKLGEGKCIGNGKAKNETKAVAKDLAVSHKMNPLWWILIVIVIICAAGAVWWLFRRRSAKSTISSRV